VTHFILNWAVIVVAVFIAAALLPGLTYASTADVLVFGLILGLLNAFVAPILRLLTLPIRLLTFGLFTLIINAALFWFAAILEGNVRVAGFLTALLAALIVSAVNVVFGRLFKG
jgi:putative membrane protein